MKYLLIILTTLFSTHLAAQNLLGQQWHINEVLGRDLQNLQEFTLNSIDTSKNEHFVYGNTITFKDDFTFSSGYSAPCGNDCFPYTTGTFQIVDNTHIRIFLHRFYQSGDCENIDLTVDRDLGIYYISIINKQSLKLIKSNGNLTQDLLNEKYSARIDAYAADVRIGSSSLLDFQTTEMENNQRVAAYMKTKMKINNYSLLYSKKYHNAFIINLVQNNDAESDYLYIINNFLNNYEYQVGHYLLKEK